MTPTAGIARRLLPGGEWWPRFARIAKKVNADFADRDDLLGESLVCVERFWGRYDPVRGNEWAYTRQLIRAAASKRRMSKGGIPSPRYCNFTALSDECKQAWESLSTVPLTALATVSTGPEPGSDRGVRLFDAIPAPTHYDDRRQAAAVRSVLLAVAERSEPHRAAWIETTIALFDRADTDLAAERGVSRQAVGRARDRAVAYLREALTPAERFTLSLARSPE